MKDKAKRSLDCLVSALALLLTAPILLLIALWVRLDSKGPVLFTQPRIGRDRRPFRILKFRTMIDRTAEAIDQHAEQVITSKSDPRITRPGRFLRGMSLDELPQLWNILRGDMSIVGPRPIVPEQLEVVPERFMSRFDVLPGLTGLAQVRGRRSLGWLQQLEADAEYVRRHGLLYDIGIIARTVVVVFGGSGVYGEAGQNWRAYRDALRAENNGQDYKETRR
ncbi:sugar transferase [Halomonas sp. IOP_31]|uniref:sugar transferase n=1 Tax=Halomonas sp. IOP_31 TaxID=2876584 RepID=UPI001E5A2C7B|nr:sugar transferase [Halomonas sp. IOP_31]MCD6007026.1 sugar transferase [Halomonas sp. IOP_31]